MNKRAILIGAGAVLCGTVLLVALKPGAANSATPSQGNQAQPSQPDGAWLRPNSTDLPAPLVYNLPPLLISTASAGANGDAYSAGQKPCACSGAYDSNLTASINGMLAGLGSKVNDYINNYSKNVLDVLPDYFKAQINNGVSVALTNAGQTQLVNFSPLV